MQGARLSKDCRKEVDDFYIDRSKNINKDPRLAEACKASGRKGDRIRPWGLFAADSLPLATQDDSAKLCAGNALAKEGGISVCLAAHKKQLSSKCKTQVDRVIRDKAYDYRFDAALFSACEADATNVCKNVQPGQGRVIGCLRDNRFQLSWECQSQVFRQEKEGADDIRTSVRLFNACRADKASTCSRAGEGGRGARAGQLLPP